MHALLLAFTMLFSQPVLDPTFFSYNSPFCLARELSEGNILPIVVRTAAPSCPWTADDAGLVELSHFATNYSWWHDDRSNNLELSAYKLDGTILLPGETLSFNTVVGERTEKEGYRKANVIVGAKGYELGLGGGICQTASTLHAASLYAGLDIVERHPHRFKVKYVAAGLDATVDYGAKDLLIRNNTLFPVVFHLGYIERGELVVRIMAPMKTWSVAYKYKVVDEIPSDIVRFEIDKKSRDRVKFFGRPGYKIDRYVYRKNIWTGERERVPAATDNYSASPWVLRVAELPGGQVQHTGLGRGDIAGFLAGSRYSVDQARFPDLRKGSEAWVVMTSIKDDRLAKMTRFKSGEEPLVDDNEPVLSSAE